MYTITPLDIISWITFGFVVGLVVHTMQPIHSYHIVKDVFLAILGSIVGGLTIGFFYGYTMLGMLTVSVVGGLILASGYVWLEVYKEKFLKTPLTPIKNA